MGFCEIMLMVSSSTPSTSSSASKLGALRLTTSRVGVLAAVFDSQYLKKARIPSVIVAAAICAATVFVKQHSILDVFAALALSLVLYLVIYVAARRGIDHRHAPAAA